MDDLNTRIIIDRLKAQDRVLADIQGEVRETKAQAKLTNGRVSALERFQAKLEGAQQALSWRTPLLVGVVCSVAGAAAAALFG